jgi:hypothetical protein
MWAGWKDIGVAERDWSERVAEVPAWVAFAASYGFLVAGWAVFGPDQERPPFGILVLSTLMLVPVFARVGALAWWRTAALIAALVAMVIVTAQIGPLALWLPVALAIMVPSAYWLVDRAWEGPR